jgi:hypothetical protein
MVKVARVMFLVLVILTTLGLIGLDLIGFRHPDLGGWGLLFFSAVLIIAVALLLWVALKTQGLKFDPPTPRKSAAAAEEARPPFSICLTEEDFFNYARKRMNEQDRTYMLRHILNCPDCADRLDYIDEQEEDSLAHR